MFYQDYYLPNIIEKKKKLKAGDTLEALTGFYSANDVHRLLPKKFLYS